MKQVNVTHLRDHLSKYLASASHGEEIRVIHHHQVIARILPPLDVQKEAKNKLLQLQKSAKIGDVISPINENWDAEK